MNINSSASTYLQKALQPGQYLKVSVKGGGCSGLQYVFEPTSEISATDIIVDTNVLIDARSQLFLKDCTLVYKEKFGASILVVENTQAKNVCGCGESFTL